jgi:hypothetical protein
MGLHHQNHEHAVMYEKKAHPPLFQCPEDQTFLTWLGPKWHDENQMERAAHTTSSTTSQS